MSQARTYLIAVGLIGAVTAAIVGGVLWEDSRARKRLTAEAETVGLVATEVEWQLGGDEGTERGHDLTFAWVDGRNGIHTETLKQVTWYRPDQRYKVCYDPADPADWRIYQASVRCG